MKNSNNDMTSAEVQELFDITKQRLHQLRTGYRSRLRYRIWRTDVDPEYKLVIPTDYYKLAGRYYYTKKGVDKIRMRLRNSLINQKEDAKNTTPTTAKCNGKKVNVKHRR